MIARVFRAALVLAAFSTPASPGIELKGRALAPDGRPVAAGHSVRCGPMGRGDNGAGPAVSVIGVDGRFRVAVPDGSPQQQLWIVDAAGRARIGWPHLSRSRDFGDVKLPAEGSLGGQLVAPGGLPVKGLRVVLLRKLDAGCTHYVESCAAAADGDGAFLFEGIPCGDHACRVESKDFAPEVHPIKVGAETYLEIHLKRGAAIAGQVAGPGGPVAGAEVTIEDLPSPVKTDASGAFAAGGLEPGRHRVTVRGGGWIGKDPAGVSVIAAEGEVATCRVEVVRSGALRVTLKPGDPGIQLPAVMEFNLDAPGRRRRVSGLMNLEASVTNGVATLAHLLPGAYEITPSDSEWGRVATQATVVAETAAEVVLVLPRTLSITGTVVDAEGKAVDAARVRVEEQEGEGRQSRYLGVDDNGRFIVRGLSAGRVAVSVEDESHLPARFEWDAASVRGEQRIVLQSGLSVAGRVTDEAGKPLEDVDVRVSFELPAETNAPARGRASRSRMSTSDSRSAETDAAGRFTVRGLPAGKVSLEVDEDGYEPHLAEIPLAAGGADHPVTLRRGSFIAGVVLEGDKPPTSTFEVSVHGPVDAARDADGPRRTVSRETETDASGAFRIEGLPKGFYQLKVSVPDTYGEAEAELDKAAAGTDDVLVSLAPKVRVPVLVLGPDGEPVAGATLSAVRMAGGGSRTFFSSGWSGFRAPNVTDAKGEGSVDARRGGRLAVTASKPPLIEAKATVDLASAPVSNVVLRMSAGLAIEGRVVDAAGKPLEGLRVVSQGRVDPFDDGVDADGGATTDKGGRFSLRGLPAGSASLAVFRTSGTADDRRLPLSGRTVVVRRDAPPVEIRLPPTGSLTGELSDTKGPVSGAYIVLAPASDPEGFSGRGLSLQTDAQGRFSVAELPAGEYRVFWVIPSEDERREPGISAVTVKAGESAELKLGGAKPAKPARRGRVMAGDIPVAGATVSVVPEPPQDAAAAEDWMMEARFRSDRAESDSNGWFEAAIPEAGRYIVRADIVGKDGPKASYMATVDLAAGDGPFEIRFRGAKVHGTARDVDGATKSSGFMMLVPSGMSDAHQAVMSRWAKVGADGIFAFDAVTPGIYSLGAPAEEAYGFRSGIVVGTNDVTVEIRDRAGIRLSGRVMLPSGEPAAGAVVTAVSMVTPMANGFQPSEDDGAYDFTPALVPGRYTLGVHLAGYAVDTAEIDLAAPTVHDWKLVEGGELTVRLAGAPRAVAGRSLRIVDATGRVVVRPGQRSSGLGGGLMDLRTGRDGRFHLKGLRPGRCEVVVDGTVARGAAEIKAGDTAEVVIAVP